MADGRSANGLQQQQQQLGGGGGGGLRGGQRRAAPLALFRASVRKKDSTVQFVATNCHVHTIYHHDDDEEKRQSLPHGTEGKNKLIVETEVNWFFLDYAVVALCCAVLCVENIGLTSIHTVPPLTLGTMGGTVGMTHVSQTVSFGIPTAHALNFKKGGLHRQLQGYVDERRGEERGTYSASLYRES